MNSISHDMETSIDSSLERINNTKKQTITQPNIIIKYFIQSLLFQAIICPAPVA